MANKTPPTKGNTPKAEAPAKPEAPKAAKPAPTARFKWNGTAEGRVAKSIIALMAGMDGKGKLPKGMADEVNRLVPQLAPAYADGTGGNELTRSMLNGRLQYMWFTAGRNGKDAIKGEPSTEHPENDACNVAFRTTYDRVKAAYPFDKALTKAQVAELGAAPVVEKKEEKAEA